MIHNFTKAEWDALLDAVSLREAVWEQDGDDFNRPATRQIAALGRALAKARQLAPESSLLEHNSTSAEDEHGQV